MPKRLITLISTKGKNSQEVAKELVQNVQKFKRVHKKSVKKVQSEQNSKQAD